MAGIKVIGYICSSDGRSPNTQKILKLRIQVRYSNVIEVRSFLRIATFYRVQVKFYIQVVVPLYRLLKPGILFSQTTIKETAIQNIQEKLISPPALISLDYSNGAGNIILGVDTYITISQGAYIYQIINNRRHPSRFESRIQLDVEKKQDLGRLKCRALVLILKKFRYQLYGVYFTVETNYRILVTQLNRSTTDLLGALIIRIIIWIQLQDFDIRYIPRLKNTIPNGLSRRLPYKGELPEDPEALDDQLDA